MDPRTPFNPPNFALRDNEDDKKDKKGNGAKGKNKTDGVSREQVAPVVLRDDMSVLPDAPTSPEAEEEKDIKAKKKTPKVRDIIYIHVMK